MSNKFETAHSRYDALRKEFIQTKKVGPYFAGLLELLNSEEGALIRSMIVSQYNFDAAKLPADKFAACAEKYGFPIRLER